MREWEIGAVENIHGALPYIRFAPILALVGVGVNRIGKEVTRSRFPALQSFLLEQLAPLAEPAEFVQEHHEADTQSATDWGTSEAPAAQRRTVRSLTWSSLESTVCQRFRP